MLLHYWPLPFFFKKGQIYYVSDHNHFIASECRLFFDSLVDKNIFAKMICWCYNKVEMTTLGRAWMQILNECETDRCTVMSSGRLTA